MFSMCRNGTTSCSASTFHFFFEMVRSKEALKQRKLKKRKRKLIQQKKLKNDLKNEKTKNFALNHELDKHKKCKMKNLSLTSVTRNNNFIKQPQLL